MSELLNVMIVPFQQERAILLPRGLVEYVLPYAPPLPSSYSHQALIGSLIYNNEKVPVIDMSVVFDNQATPLSEIDGRRRIVILSCLTKPGEFSSYALLSHEAPRFLELSASDLRETITDVPRLFYSHVKLSEQNTLQSLYVPDLVALESELFE